jgi:uncharacterized membrane protein YkvI
VDGVFREKQVQMPLYLRPAVGVLLLIVAAVVARFGLIDLIAKGYGTITWGFWLVYVIPTLTLGVWIILKKSRNG